MKLLKAQDYDVTKAMVMWAGMANAIVIDDDDDDDDDGPSECESSKGTSNVVQTMYSSSYGRISKMIRLVATLSKVTLPTIVVIGSESAGKSSTLERIAGFSLFPRDAKICTRMPIKLSLINSDDSDGKVVLKFPGRADQVIDEAGAATAVGKLMAEVVPPGHGVVDQQLTIEVRKPSVPTLDLVDLPGIVAASIEGEPADMMTRTRAITERYLRDRSTIVVAVVPANITRVRDSQAMQLVQAAGKEAVTLGVLAKADLAHDPRYKQRKHNSPYWELQQRLAGGADDVVQLPNGWVAVKNRDTLVEEEEAGGLQQSSQAEREWFSNEAKVPDEQCGIDALLSKIDTLFTNHIKTTWVPHAVSHLECQSADVASQIDALGRSPSSLTLKEVLADFTNSFTGTPVERIIEPGVFKVTSDFYNSVLNEAVGAESIPLLRQERMDHPTLKTIFAKKLLEDGLIKALPTLVVDLMGGLMAKAVDATFETGSFLRLERFEVLHDAICQACVELLKGQIDTFVKEATHSIQLYFMRSVGVKQNYVDSAFLVRVIAELVLRELVAPLVTEPDKIADVLSASGKSKPAQQSKGRKRKANDAEGSEDDQVDVSHLLVESCASKRSELVARKHDLFVALSEVNKI